MLAGDEYGEEVRADEARANEIGITGVPCFVIDGRFAIPGAQDAKTIGLVLERAWERRTPVVVGGGDGSAACEGDACAI